ncbi:MAG: hypothetical protein RLZZ297_1569 [Chloroflexota bacterium]
MTTAEAPHYRYLVVAPLPPSRGGIAHFSAQLVTQLRSSHTVTVWAISPLYPAWLFPGNSAADPALIDRTPVNDARIHGWSPQAWLRQWASVVPGQYDAIIWQWWTPYWIPFLLVLLHHARRCAIPTIALNHQLVEPDAAPWQHRLARSVLRRAAGVVSFGQHSQTHQREKNLPLPLHTAVLGPPLPPPVRAARRAALRTAWEIPAAAFVVLCFGFVRPYKGTDIVVAALHDTPATVYLVIAGEWWRTDAALRAACAHPAVRTRVRIVDRYLPDADIADHFAACDVVALAYRSGSVSGVATLAAACGVPLLTSAVGALGGLAAAHDVVHPNTPNAWAATLTQRAAAPPPPVVPVPSQPGWLALQRAVEELTAATGGAQ